MAKQTADVSVRIDPLKIEDWQTYVKLYILESMRCGAEMVHDIIHSLCDFNETRRLIQLRFKHELEIREVQEIIREMYRDFLIKPAKYVCKCCEEENWPDEEVLTHVITFQLSMQGRALIPENVPNAVGD